MKYNELTEKDKEWFSETYLDTSVTWSERMGALESFIGKGEKTVRAWAKKLDLLKKENPEPEQYKIAKLKQHNETKKRFIITWAQNGTPVDERFITNIEGYAKYINAELHVIAGRYKNPTSIFADKEQDNWDDRILPYLDANRHDIHKYVSIMSDIKIPPTGVNPMSGLKGVSRENSCVFGAPKIQMEMIPVLEGQRPKMMVTTGACTKSNYTDSKSGKKGEFHHMLGFVIVEIKDDETFFIRQVNATENGDFIDLYYKTEFKGSIKPVFNEHDILVDGWVGDSSTKVIDKIAGCVLGDLHYGHHDPVVLSKTMEFLDILKPKHVILHDVFDGHSISHHERKNPFIQYQRELDGTNSLKLEVSNMLEHLEEFTKFKNVVIVRSNHDDFVDRWLIDLDWRKASTMKNSLEYMKYAAAIMEGKAPQGVVPYLINERFPKFKTLGRSSSYKIKDWEVGQHGDKGQNGSRGSLNQFRNLNTKIIVGHYHSPGRKDGALAVGTSTHLRVGYNEGASGWLQSHVIIHKNGKTQHINFTDGEFTTFKIKNKK